MPSENDDKKVRSIAPELLQRQLAHVRQLAEKTHLREPMAMVEMVEAMHRISTLDLDGALRELGDVDDPEAAEAIVGLRCARALECCLGGDVEGGLAEWQAVTAEHPTTSVPYIFRGRWRLHECHDPRGALADFERAVAVAPAASSGYRWRAQCFETLGDVERALANYRRAASLDPEDVDVLYAVAKALSKHGDYDEAVAAWKRLVELEPKYLDFWVGLAREHVAGDDYPAALLACEKAIACAPERGNLYWERTRLRQELADPPADVDAANLRDYDLALEKGYRKADVFVNKADILAQRGRLAEAVATCDAAAAEHPDDGWVFVWRAEFKRRLGDAKGARADDARGKRLGWPSIRQPP